MATPEWRPDPRLIFAEAAVTATRDTLRRALLASFDPDLEPCNHYDTVCDWCERLPRD